MVLLLAFATGRPAASHWSFHLGFFFVSRFVVDFLRAVLAVFFLVPALLDALTVFFVVPEAFDLAAFFLPAGLASAFFLRVARLGKRSFAAGSISRIIFRGLVPGGEA